MTPNRRVLFLVRMIVVLMLWGTAAPADARMVEILGSEAQPISLAVNTGRLIRLEAAPDTVFIADPAIADVQVKSPRLIYLFARKAGKTSLFAVDSKERVLLNRSIVVGYDLERLRSEIRSVLPGAAITVDLQIGRASCRERCAVRVDLGGRRTIKQKKNSIKQYPPI